MTKRKAIEVALSRWNKVRKEDGFTAVDVEDVIVGTAVERAYEAGRIAGLREACTWLFYREDRKKLRAHANALAKKARSRCPT